MAHVFVSYVQENRDNVDVLVEILRTFGVDVWLDRDQIRAGQRWEEAIRNGIREGAFYVACFSEAYNARARSYMNAELTIAIEELRQRPTDRTWFIPLILDNAVVPDRSIGGGETLRSLQWVDLSKDYYDGIRRILASIDPTSARVYELTNALRSSSARERIHAADALGKLGPLATYATRALSSALGDDNATVRAAASDALGRIGVSSAEIISGLESVIQNGEYYSSQHAIKALKRIDTPEARAALTRWATDR